MLTGGDIVAALPRGRGHLPRALPRAHPGGVASAVRPALRRQRHATHRRPAVGLSRPPGRGIVELSAASSDVPAARAGGRGGGAGTSPPTIGAVRREQVRRGEDEARVLPPAEATVTAHQGLERSDVLRVGVEGGVDVDLRRLRHHRRGQEHGRGVLAEGQQRVGPLDRPGGQVVPYRRARWRPGRRPRARSRTRSLRGSPARAGGRATWASISSRVRRWLARDVDQTEVAAPENDQLGSGLRAASGGPRCRLDAPRRRVRHGRRRLCRRGPRAPSRRDPTPRCCPPVPVVGESVGGCGTGRSARSRSARRTARPATARDR